MEEKKLTCIVCPMGCSLTVQLENGAVCSVSGNTCPRGDKYAREECVRPTRTLTTTMKVADRDMVSVKSVSPLPKDQLFDCMAQINQITLTPPVHIGQVVLPDVNGTGIDIIATKNMI